MTRPTVMGRRLTSARRRPAAVGRRLLAACRRRTATARPAPGADRGSGALVVIFFAVVVLALAAFVVDGGLSIAQRERAADIAEQAARYAAQDLDEAALREGVSPAPINFGNCANRVAEYAASVGMEPADIAAAECSEAAANQVTVRIRLTYRPVFTGIVYDRPLTVWGEATAEAQVG